ncbi:MAG: hypothetical protein JJT81_16515, partial [Rubellimicrobium sp.]|nr:hypothetical protein [Rubellimicrobium sp.]
HPTPFGLWVLQLKLEPKSFRWFFRATDGRPEPINHVHSIGRAYLSLHLASPCDDKIEKVTEILDVFFRTVQIDENGFAYWTFLPFFDISARDWEPSEKIYKAAVSVGLPFMAQKTGVIDRQPELDSILATILDVLESSPLRSHLRADHSIRASELHTASRLPRIANFLQLASYEPRISDLVLSFMFRGKESSESDIFRTPRHALAYAYSL